MFEKIQLATTGEATEQEGEWSEVTHDARTLHQLIALCESPVNIAVIDDYRIRCGNPRCNELLGFVDGYPAALWRCGECRCWSYIQRPNEGESLESKAK